MSNPKRSDLPSFLGGESKPHGSDAPKPTPPLPCLSPKWGQDQAAEIQRQVREGINRSGTPGTPETATERMQKK